MTRISGFRNRPCDTDRAPPSPGRREGGMALVLVLWVLMLLSLIVAGFMTLTRSETRTVRARIDQVEAMALADGGVYWAIERLLAVTYTDEGSVPAIATNGLPIEVPLDQGHLQVRVRNADGLVDLNGAEEPLLRGLLIQVGAEPALADVLAQRIVDFRDVDNRPLPLGAEDTDYLAAGLAHDARDAPLDRMDEIRQVLGMPPAIASALMPYVTVYSGSRGIDPTKAPLTVLSAVPDMTDFDIERYLEGQKRGEAFDAQLAQRNPLLIASNNSTFHITVAATTIGGGHFIREAVILLTGSTPHYQIRHWAQGRADIPHL